MLIKQPKSLKIRGRIALGYAVILVMLGLFLVIVSSRITDLEKETVYLSDHDIEVHELTYRIEKTYSIWKPDKEASRSREIQAIWSRITPDCPSGL